MRALSEPERRQRRDQLAQKALELLAQGGYGPLTVEAVAKAAAVAKGTVFLSFASKEDLVLHAVGLRFDAWFSRLGALGVSPDADSLAQSLYQSVAADPLLPTLMGLVGPVLEQGCSHDAVVRFKEGLASNLGAAAVTWAERYPSVSRERWLGLFLRVHATLVGAWAVSDATENVRGALADRPDLQALLVSFEPLVVPILAALLRDVVFP